jgi:amidohydrolase
VNVGPKITASEDFSEYQKIIPGFFFFLGVTPKGTDVSEAASNHSPRFFVDESGLLLEVRSLAHLTVDYMEIKKTRLR